jgi:hypothetical protein
MSPVGSKKERMYIYSSTFDYSDMFIYTTLSSGINAAWTSASN